MHQQIRFCTATDGVKLAYALSGDGPPLAMCARGLRISSTNGKVEAFYLDRTRTI